MVLSAMRSCVWAASAPSDWEETGRLDWLPSQIGRPKLSRAASANRVSSRKRKAQPRFHSAITVSSMLMPAPLLASSPPLTARQASVSPAHCRHGVLAG
ncbi:hypothetical protein KTAU_20420 [Thermogemmatispora aurantia]|uniref:Uncharacterized protein n=1 Tax=Thermogemmatispora aurantia TaxID=2045279 RepID=A0A5J4K792_9CHLR|nr:hypothetical protein KTAU_20420 [Thermogemmatispora aurantia]